MEKRFPAAWTMKTAIKREYGAHWLLPASGLRAHLLIKIQLTAKWIVRMEISI